MVFQAAASKPRVKIFDFLTFKMVNKLFNLAFSVTNPGEEEKKHVNLDFVYKILSYTFSRKK